jgi:P4 family phage/plasmid primase-like protien
MLLSSQKNSFSDFLIKHNANKTKNGKGEEEKGIKEITHTRIGSKEYNIYGGAYTIPKEELSTFYELYYQHVFVQKKSEYLTEKQVEDGPLLIDLDFRYEYDIETRQHTKDHIVDFLSLYLDELKTHFVMLPEVKFDIFVFEKPEVNRVEDKTVTKDGIHIMIGIQCDHIVQRMIRSKILDKMSQVSDLPLTNTWDSVLDKGISEGTTNWQLYGSKKPNNDAYDLTYYYVGELDDSDGEFMLEEKDVKEFKLNLEKNFYKVSAQNTDLPKFELNPKIQNLYNKMRDQVAKKSKPSFSKNSNVKIKEKEKERENQDIGSDIEDGEDIDDDTEGKEPTIMLSEITDAEMLEKAVNQMLKRLKLNESDILETHQYTQILPAKYYEPGSHLLNRSVAFALKNTDERLFLSWVQLRSKATDFDYSSIPELYTMWKKYFHKKEDGITKRSIMYWAKQDAYEDFLKVKNNSINAFIEESLNTATDFDFAQVLYQMYKDKYVCCSIQNKTWFIFKNHRWEPDKGLTLRMAISKEMFHLYHSKMEELQSEYQQNSEDQEKIDYLKKKVQQISNISAKLKKTNDKNNIMREAMELFYDKDFIKCMDTNKYLMCFNNGVVDFKNKVFRDGYPQDYITKTTGIRYEAYKPEDPKQLELSKEILTFMEKLFPIPSLNLYMWDHLASCLIGVNVNQTFNIYRGSGSNGKSILTDLMSMAFGEYKGTVPITLVTEKRSSIGGTSSEIVQLKGLRYAVMQEPSKNTKINEGIMKELTGGDPLQGRALYSESETFEPQFKLVVCTNHLFDIQSNDDGTWRRIRICDFLAKFVDENEKHTDDTPYVFPKDKELKEKLPKYAPVFMSMLVKRVFETDGHVKDCDVVTAASNKYRQGQDLIAGFLNEMIIKTGNPKDKIKKQELVQQFKVWYQQEQQSGKMPKSQEIYDVMDKKYGNYKEGWKNVKIHYEEVEDDLDDL